MSPKSKSKEKKPAKTVVFSTSPVSSRDQLTAVHFGGYLIIVGFFYKKIAESRKTRQEVINPKVSDVEYCKQK